MKNKRYELKISFIKIYFDLYLLFLINIRLVNDHLI